MLFLFCFFLDLFIFLLFLFIFLRIFILYIFSFNIHFFVFLALVSVECVWTHIYVGGVVLQAYSSHAFTCSLLSISGFLCSHSLLLFLSLSFLSYVFVRHSGWSWYPEQSNKERPLIPSFSIFLSKIKRTFILSVSLRF
jgi:hypothetical protein